MQETLSFSVKVWYDMVSNEVVLVFSESGWKPGTGTYSEQQRLRLHMFDQLTNPRSVYEQIWEASRESAVEALLRAHDIGKRQDMFEALDKPKQAEP